MGKFVSVNPYGENTLDKSHIGCLWNCSRLAARPLTTRRIDVEENAEKNRENARLSVKTPTKNVEKVAYSGTHHKKPNIETTSRAVTDEQSATVRLFCL